MTKLPFFDSLRVRAAHVFCALLAFTLFPGLPACAARRTTAPVEIPAEVRSTHFVVSVNGMRSPVVHAATNYYFLNFDVDGPTTIAVTADDPHFWDRGVEVQPMRLGIRPVRCGATVTFQLARPEKMSISRPGDHFSGAEMLFLFANTPETYKVTSTSAGVRYFGPGVHRENIDAQSGDRIYLAPGAVILGGLNIWQVHDVRVFGRGTIIYDGPQYPYNDEGWMHKKNWHCIVMDEATDIEIDGITCVTRSRSWQIQMKDSRKIGFYNIKVIGGNPNNANQDGMDWLGGGDTMVRNSFFRASDDVFALQGNWDGYDLALMRKPGHDVTNITIENSVLSTSISNTIRVAWPQKTFNSAHFQMSDVDVIHTGFGGCKVPFAFFELWADPDGHGTHQDYRFHNIRMEDWYSLLQIRQPAPGVRDVRFDDVWAMDGPAMVPPVLLGDVSGVALHATTEQGIEGAEVDVKSGAAAPVIEAAVPVATLSYTRGLLRPGMPITFKAPSAAAEGTRFEWMFGDGARGSGEQVQHTYRDAEGTLLDGSGRFRVTLHQTNPDGRESWMTEHVVLARAGAAGTRDAGPTASGLGHRVVTTIRLPEDGGYTFTLLTSRKASLRVDDGAAAMSPPPQPQVCGAPGDAVQAIVFSAALHAGEHRLAVEQNDAIENAEFVGRDTGKEPLLLIEGPGMARQVLPASLVVSSPGLAASGASAGREDSDKK